MKSRNLNRSRSRQHQRRSFLAQHKSAAQPRFSRRLTMESLEERRVLATLTWEGDVGANWNDGTAGVDTNWISAGAQVLPASGDTLVFPGGAGNTVNNNNTTAGNSYILQVTGAGYQIGGNSITLNLAGTDIDVSAIGLIATPLALAADTTVNVSAGGTIDLNGVLSGAAGGLTKTGAGALILNQTNTYGGATDVQQGILGIGSGGSINSLSTVSLQAGTLTGTAVAQTGAANAPVNALAGSQILASNNSNLTLGLAASAAGFSSAGSIVVGTNALLTLNDADSAALGPNTVLGGGTATLAAANGVALSAGDVLSGSGTVQANIVVGTGTISPGTSAGTISVTGNVDLTNSSYAAEIDGNAAGQYDRLDITGSATLTGATLSLAGSDYAPVAGDSFTILTTTAGITGTFVGLPEGSNVFVNGRALTVSYAGGNVTLTLDATPVINAPNDANAIVVRRTAGGNIQVVIDAVTVLDQPLSSLTNLTINGGTNDDTLTLAYDFAGGFFSLPVFFNGGGGVDALVINDAPGTATTVTHTFINATDGSVNIDGSLTTYTGLSPVTDNMGAANRIFTFTGGAETVTLDASGVLDNRIDSTLGELVDFVNPTTSLTINLTSGADTLNVQGLDAAFSANFNVDGDGGDILNFQTAATNLGAGNLVVTDIVDVNFNANVTTTGAATVSATGAIADGAAAISVGGLASFSGSSITLDNPAAHNFGSLTFNSAGLVTIIENSATTLSGTNTAASLVLTSAGAITDDATADLAVTGNASLSGTSITLGDQAANDVNFGSLTFTSAGAVVVTEDSATSVAGANTANTLSLTSAGAITDAAGASLAITGNAAFSGTSITISAAATANFGSLTFNSAGAVNITEDSDTQIAGANTANSLVLTSAGAITDATGATVNVTTTSALAGTSISLTDNGADSFVAGGNASFTASGGGAITIAAAGTANFGTLTFSTTGPVNITEDSSTALAATSSGGAITLNSAGAITDAENDAANEITGTDLILTAVGGIGTSPNPIHIAVVNLDVSNTVGGGIFVTDTAGGLTLTNLGGPNANAVNGVGGNGLIRAASPLTIAANAITSGGMTYTASDSAAAGDDLTVNAGVTVQDTSAALTMNGGDNVTFNTGTTVRASTALAINGDSLGGGVADPGVGSIMSLFGTIQSDTAGITITGNGDNDSITIDNNGAAAGGTLDGVVVGAVQLFTINGNGGSDTLTLEDGGDLTGDTYTITATTISTGGGNLFNNAPGLNYANLETINIQNSNGPTNADGDTVTVTSLNPGTTYNVDGNNPTGLPGDRLILNPPGSINVYEIGGNYVFEFPGSGNLVATEFETIDLRPGNGILNIIGDEGQGQAGGANGGAGNDEQDKITVVGTGIGTGTLQLSHNAAPIGVPPLVIFSGVTRLNVNTFELADGLAVTPYANNTPQGWGIETYYNEGAPVLDGDLLIYNGVLGVSETIVVAPSASQAGQVFSNNAATDTPIAVINYQLNVNIIVNGSSPAGTVGDTDTLTLRGTDPANPGTSGNETFDVDFTAAGIPGDELAIVTDTVGGGNLYSLQNFSNFNSINFAGLAGNDTFLVTNRPGLTVNIDGGDPVAGLPVGGIPTSDTLAYRAAASSTISQGANPATGTITQPADGPINFAGVEVILAVSRAAGSTLTINGTDAGDNFSVQGGGGIVEALVTLNAGPQIGVNYLLDADPENIANLVLNGSAGDDTFSVSSNLLDSIQINGGDPTASDTVIINGTTGTDNVTIDQLTLDGARVVGLGPTINIATAEHLIYSGQGGNDNLTVTTPAGAQTVDFGAGAVADAGRVLVSQGGLVSSLPIEFQSMGINGDVILDDPAAGRVDTLVFHASELDDYIDVAAVTGNLQAFDPAAGSNDYRTLLVQTPGIIQVTLAGLAGDDIFDVPGNHPFSSAFGLNAIEIQGGSPSASDVVNFTGTGGAVTIDLAAQTITEAGFGPVGFTGIETLNVEALGGAITVLGHATAESIDVTPTGANTATIVPSGLNLTINTSNTGLLTVDALGGSDTVSVHGTSSADAISVSRSATTTVTVAALKLVNLPAASTEALVVAGGLGIDDITVTGAAGPANLLIDGGSPSASDVLNVIGQTIVTVNYGTDPSGGLLNTTGGDIAFEGLATINLTTTGGGTLTVNGTNANDAINQNGNSVSVNDGAVVNFIGYTTLTLNGNAGSDEINVHPTTLAGVTTFNVNGGDPTASDTVVVNGTAGADTITYSPTGADSGTVAVNAAPIVNLATVEHLTIDGLGGNDNLTVNVFAGINVTQYTPGTTLDSGSILAGNTLPLAFENFGFAGSITLANAGGRVGALVYNGTATNDLFIVNAAGQIELREVVGVAVIPRSLPVLTPGIGGLRLSGHAGDDLFNLPGNHLFGGGITVDGGSPSASDVLNFTGSGAGAVTVDLGNRTVTEAGFAPVVLIGVEVLNLNANNANLTILGTIGDETLDVSPTGPGSGSATSSLIDTPLINFDNVGTFLVNLGGGDDTLAVRYSSNPETIEVNGPAGSVSVSAGGVFETVNFTNVDSLRVFGNEGDDTFNVTPAADLPIFIDGGDPIGESAGDLLNVLVAPEAFEPGPENDEGGFVFNGAERVSFDHIEAIGPIIGAPCIVILGTHGDDDITVIARDASYQGVNPVPAGLDGVQDFTVSVNGGLEILYVDVPLLYIDALAGDDDIVFRTPAPNGQVWDVEAFVAGGTPSAVTGDQGDVLELETPGTQTVTYTPTGSDTGVINLITLTSTITIGSFLNACPSAPGANDGYNSSPGGVEEFVYDGEGGNDLFTIIGTAAIDTITHTPGTGNDEGTLRVNTLLGVRYQNLGLAATLTVDGGALADNLIVDGTQYDDTIGVAAVTGTVTVNARLAINQVNVERLTLHGLNGDDAFNIAGNHPYASIGVEGGSPSASDELNFTSSGGNVTVDFAASSVVEAGFGAVLFSGVETLNANAGGADLTVLGTANDDHFVVTPDATAATTRLVFNNTTVNASGLDQFFVDGVSGDDRLTVNATVTGNTVDVTGTFVDIAIPNRQRVDYLNIDELHVHGSSGADAFNVIPSAATSMFIDGGLPAAGAAGIPADTLLVSVPASASITQGADSTTGQILTGGGAVVNFAAVEAVVLSAGDGGTLTVNATDDNDTIAAADVGVDAVWVNDGPVIVFIGFSSLTLNGRFGNDQFSISPTGLAVTSITVNGGDPTASDSVVVTGTAGADAITYTPSGIDAGTVQVNAAPAVILATVEHLTISGQAGGDTLTVVGAAANERYVHTPGNAFDAGSVGITNLTAGLTNLGVSYVGLGLGGAVVVDGGGAQGGLDTLVALGTGGRDIMTGTFTATDAINLVLISDIGGHVPVQTIAVENYTLDTLEGDDIINLRAAVDATGNFTVQAGGPSGSDVLNLLGDPATVETVTIAPDTFNPLDQDIDGLGATINASGVELITYTGQGDDDTLIVDVGDGDQTARVDDGVTGDRVTSSSLPTIEFDGLDLFQLTQSASGNVVATFVLTSLSGAASYESNLASQDSLVVEGSESEDDDFTVTLPAIGFVNVASSFGISVTEVGSASVNLHILGLNGDDSVTVNVNGTAPISNPITFDGGLGADLLIVTGTPGALAPDAFDEVIYTPGPLNNKGRLEYLDGGTREMLIDFVDLEPVFDFTAATTLTVFGTNASNAINYSGGALNNGRVSVDGFETIEFQGKTNLVINALSGSDTINLNNPGTPFGLTSITVNGGGPTASDTVVVNGTTAGEAIAFTPTASDAGTVQVGALPLITLNTVEHLTINGLGGDDDLTVVGTASSDLIIHTPGAGRDEGTVRVNELLAGDYRNLGLGGSLVIDAAGGIFDQLHVQGTGGDDRFDVAATTGVITQSGSGPFALNDRITLATTSIEDLVLNGLEGDDEFTINNPQPYLTITVNGGGPAGSDVLNFNAGPAGAVSLDLGNSSISQNVRPLDYSGVETINLNANLQSLSVIATAGDDDLTVTVASETSGQIEIGLAVQQSGQVAPNVTPPLVNYSGLAAAPGNALAVDMADGNDTLVIVGNTSSQTFDVDVPASSVAVDAGLGGVVTYLNNESLEVFGLEGDDAFTVTVGDIPVFIDGGDPIGVLPGDSITVLGAIGFFPGPESDEGGFLSGGGTVGFDHIESITVIDTDDDCPFLILGTNGDDDITVIARDASYIVPPAPVPPGLDGVQDFTVSINAGPNILFVGEPDLYIDALSGDDDIVVRTPAPNGADWNVNVRVAGGSPSIGEPNEGDRLVLETPGIDNVEFRPTGADSGSLVINEGATANYQPAEGDSIITFAPFIFECLDDLGNVEFAYVSSRGGVELVEYDGEGELNDEDNPAGTILDADDVLSIFTDALLFDADTTTTVAPDGLGTGTFVSTMSPLFHFRSFQELIVNGSGAGFDHVVFNATEGPDTITSDADTLILAGTLDHFVTLGTSIDRLDVNTFGGNDSIDLDLQLLGLAKIIDAGAGNDIVNLSGVIVDPADPIIFGGLGDDNIVGSPNPDQIFGGFGQDTINGGDGVDDIYGEAGNDTITGGLGADRMHGGDDFDIFIWNVLDGSDIIDGGTDGADILNFNGSAAAETFTLRPAPTNATHNNVILGAATVDTHGVEQINILGAAGADNFIVEDLTPTEVAEVNLDLGPAGEADNVRIIGRTVSDNLSVTVVTATAPTRVNVAGLKFDVEITGVAAGGLDTLSIEGREGNDTILASDDLNTLYTSAQVNLIAGSGDDFVSGFGTIFGDAGNDTLVGGAFGQTISGGAGDDFIRGGGGIDTLNGDAGEDTFLHDIDAVADIYNGGTAAGVDTEFDTILFRGGTGNDTMSANQSAAAVLVTTLGAALETDTLGLTVAGARTIDRVRLEGQSGDDTFFLKHLDGLGQTAVVDAVTFDVDGGAHFTRDRLSVQDDALAPGLGDLLLYRKGESDSAGSISVGPGNPESLENYFNGVEFIQPIAGVGGQVIVFKHDGNEWNDDTLNATHLGAGYTLNVDPTIDPGPLAAVPVGFDPLPGDQDFYRLTPSSNGTLDIQVYFTVIATVPSGRPGLPGNGDLDIQLFDADGTLIVNGLGPNFGTNDADSNERIRIPAVAGQTYFLRVVGAGVAINNYTMTIINEPAAVPIDLELDDRIIQGAVAAGGNTTTSINSNLDGQFPSEFFTGKVVSFLFGTTTVGLRGEEALVTAYNGATGVFTLSPATPLSVAPAAGDTFQVESVDTGRSNNDNITRDNTPTIFLRVPNVVNLLGVATLDDLPYNGTAPGNPPDEFIGIPFVTDLTLAATASGFRVPIFVTENGTSDQGPPNNVLAGYAQPVDPVNRPGLFTFTFGSAGSFITSLTPDGSYFISARVEMIDPADPEAQGYGGYATSLEIFVDTASPPVAFGDPGIVGDGLISDSDSFVIPNPETIIDRVTNDLTPTFWGRAEADASLRLYADTYVDINGNGVFDFIDNDGDGIFGPGDVAIDTPPDGNFDPNTDIFIGQNTSIPLDGNQQEPNGFWKVESVINFNDPRYFIGLGGTRTVFAVGEDVAGNVNDNVTPQELDIFIDVQGPQITDVTANAASGTAGDDYNLFDPKPSTDGPSPLVNSIFIEIRDLPFRDLPDFDYPAFKADIASNPGHYLVTGDYNGIIPILDVNVFLDPTVDGEEATGRVELVFRTPGADGVFNTSDDIGAALPDDRFTLFVNDDGIIDYANNKLDGESNADEPHNSPPGTGEPDVLGVDGVPTGDVIPGGDFVARFTIDSRPELAVWAAGSAFIDINGNTIWDPDNADFTNRDITHVYGLTSDDLFAGNFAPNVNRADTPQDDRIADGFDKLGAYGRIGTTTFRWLIDTDNDGVSDVEVFDPLNINGLPVAGRFDLSDGVGGNGDEVGLFTGNTWWFDTNHNFQVDTSIAWPLAGHAIVGDFDGDGVDDLATWSNDTFSFDLSSIGAAGPVAGLNNGVLGTGVNGTIDRTFRFGFIGPNERPVAADMNQDGIEDVGLWMPARDGITPRGQAEWYFLISGVTQNDTPPQVPTNLGPTITGTGDPTPGSYLANPALYGLTSYAGGRIVADPLTPGQNIVRFQPVPFGNDQYMQFGDEFALPLVGNFDPPVSPIDVEFTNPRDNFDVNNDGSVNTLDILAIVNYLTENGAGPAPSGGFISAPFCDVTADSIVNTLDILGLVNHITEQFNAQSGVNAEGEGNDDYFTSLGSGDEDDDDDLLGLLAGE